MVSQTFKAQFKRLLGNLINLARLSLLKEPNQLGKIRFQNRSTKNDLNLSKVLPTNVYSFIPDLSLGRPFWPVLSFSPFSFDQSLERQPEESPWKREKRKALTFKEEDGFDFLRGFAPTGEEKWNKKRKVCQNGQKSQFQKHNQCMHGS